VFRHQGHSCTSASNDPYSSEFRILHRYIAESIRTKVWIGWTMQTLTTNSFPHFFPTNSTFADITLHPTQAMKRREMNELRYIAGYSSMNTFRHLITLRVIPAPQ
jgi:hypothetical protein